MVACIQPNLSSGEVVGSRCIPDKPGSWRFELDSFHDALVVRRLRF